MARSHWIVCQTIAVSCAEITGTGHLQTAMSKKDYRAVAKILRELKMTSPMPKDWDIIIDKLARVFKEDNPRFSYQRFWDYINGQ
jgi:hypothetical protein